MNFSSQGKQLQIDVFRSSLDGWNKSNRWVELGDTLPWDEIEQLYNERLNNGKRGAGNKPARMIIGALVIKHKMNLSDEETIEIEATFGTGKRIYRANNIRGKLPEMANCWTGMCYFVKNVMKFL